MSLMLFWEVKILIYFECHCGTIFDDLLPFLTGATYYIFGYGLSYGRSDYTNPFIAFGDFMVDPPTNDPLMGQIFTAFFFQLSFATTATTILSGTVAERINFHAYCLFSMINTVVYCVPAGWV